MEFRCHICAGDRALPHRRMAGCSDMLEESVCSNAALFKRMAPEPEVSC